MLSHVYLRASGAFFSLSLLIIANQLLNAKSFGQFAYIIQAISISTLVSQCGYEFLIQKSSARKLKYNLASSFSSVSLTLIPTSLLTILILQLITKKYFDFLSLSLILVATYTAVTQRCYAGFYLGKKAFIKYQISDHVVRWFPIFIVCLIFYLSKLILQTDFELHSILITSIITTITVLTLGRYLFKREFSRNYKLLARVKLRRKKMFQYGFFLNIPNLVAYFTTIADQIILMSILSLELYGNYKIALLSISFFNLFGDVIALNLRSKFLSSRSGLEAKIYRKIVTKLQILSSIEFITGILFLMIYLFIYKSNYLFLMGLLLCIHAPSVALGTPVFALKKLEMQKTCTQVLTIVLILSSILAIFLVNSFGLNGACLSFGAASFLAKFPLAIILKRKFKNNVFK